MSIQSAMNQFLTTSAVMAKFAEPVRNLSIAEKADKKRDEEAVRGNLSQAYKSLEDYQKERSPENLGSLTNKVVNSQESMRNNLLNRLEYSNKAKDVAPGNPKYQKAYDEAYKNLRDFELHRPRGIEDIIESFIQPHLNAEQLSKGVVQWDDSPDKAILERPLQRLKESTEQSREILRNMATRKNILRGGN